MLHEVDLALRRFPGSCPARAAPVCATGGYPPNGIPARRTALGLAPWPGGRSMHPAALRVLETTWRLWREPVA